jgi:hypothetical protein
MPRVQMSAASVRLVDEVAHLYEWDIWATAKATGVAARRVSQIFRMAVRRLEEAEEAKQHRSEPVDRSIRYVRRIEQPQGREPDFVRYILDPSRADLDQHAAEKLIHECRGLTYHMERHDKMLIWLDRCGPIENVFDDGYVPLRPFVW